MGSYFGKWVGLITFQKHIYHIQQTHLYMYVKLYQREATFKINSTWNTVKCILDINQTGKSMSLFKQTLHQKITFFFISLNFRGWCNHVLNLTHEVHHFLFLSISPSPSLFMFVALTASCFAEQSISLSVCLNISKCWCVCALLLTHTHLCIVGKSKLLSLTHLRWLPSLCTLFFYFVSLPHHSEKRNISIWLLV